MAKPARSRSDRPTGRGLRVRAAALTAHERVIDDPLPVRSTLHPTSLPASVARQAQREMDRLRRLPTGSPEAAQVRAYLHWLWSLPWEHTSSEDANLKDAERVLERDHLGLAKAKERILEYLAVRRLKPDLPGPALCLVGPPGTGKSSLGAAVAHALDRPFVRISVSGTTNVDELAGVPRVLPDGQPGRIVRALREAGTRNPVLMIDGIDRISGESGLRVVELLLDLLSPESSSQFTDRYLGLPIDLSHTVLLLCANTLEMIPDALQEHLDLIEVPGYSEDEKLEIARRFLLPRQLTAHGLSARDLQIADDALRAIVRRYTLEAGVRGLARQLATACRKVARARVTGDSERHLVGIEDLDKYLGHRLFAPETLAKDDEVGVALGLAYTTAGGEVLVVEALKMPGTGRVVTTGQLGEVMRESVQAAHSYVRSRADLLEIPADAFSETDIHIHFPAAGVPKDGPSAGVTIGLVIASVLSDKPIRHDVAMTGEVSLRGKVLVVGGLREKALAAHRSGIRTFLFPAANLKDVEDIPEDVRDCLELIAVENMDEVFAIALHRVIVPQRIGGNFVIEVDDDDEEIEIEEE
ncbi:MAG: AAA family ATPase [Candidatus Eisenbacteria bacterium]|uniref:endopeptidase La n=1 Tax=Eiseniibacteriota bacterium TaxID=2212470 RepID=A0A849SX34_UNCEI|nr:AAA family ATPase [Candidatus Eisenbacteria bacterium]